MADIFCGILRVGQLILSQLQKIYLINGTLQRLPFSPLAASCFPSLHLSSFPPSCPDPALIKLSTAHLQRARKTVSLTHKKSRDWRQTQALSRSWEQESCCHELPTISLFTFIWIPFHFPTFSESIFLHVSSLLLFSFAYSLGFRCLMIKGGQSENKVYGYLFCQIKKVSDAAFLQWFLWLLYGYQNYEFQFQRKSSSFCTDTFTKVQAENKCCFLSSVYSFLCSRALYLSARMRIASI